MKTLFFKPRNKDWKQWPLYFVTVKENGQVQGWIRRSRWFRHPYYVQCDPQPNVEGTWAWLNRYDCGEE